MRTFKDDRGKNWFDLVPEIAGQIDVIQTHPGVIRAFHYHQRKTEYFFAVEGDFKIVIKKKTLKISHLAQGEVLKVEPGTWHGYQVLSKKNGIMLEISDNKFDLKKPDDKQRPYDAFYKWEIERK